MRPLLLCLLLLACPASAHSAIAQLEMRPGISASAGYFAGQRDKPAVLLLAVVPGASHFMDGAHEFDLLENTLAFLKRTQAAPSR